MTKLISVKPSDKPDKKYVAEFMMPNGRTKNTHFGAKGYLDFTHGATDEQHKAYKIRHKKDLDTADPTKAGFLSYYLLWGDSRNLQTNIASFKRKFRL